MKSLNENLFENIPLVELEERLEMVAMTLAVDSDAQEGGGDHSCSSIDCIQHT
jgi:hypothetical protein